MKESVTNKYIKWILKKVGVSAIDLKEYSLLFKKLFSHEFTWYVPNDDNRLVDGLNLRLEYGRETGVFIPDFDPPCSVLEVISALALRIEIDIMGDPDDEHPEKWFWIMLENLGLNEYKNDVFRPEIESEIDEKVKIFVERRYDRYGNGSLFPSKNARNDQKKVEIWYQLATFLAENYDI